MTGVTLSFVTVMLLEGHSDGEDLILGSVRCLQRKNDPACSNTGATEANMLLPRRIKDGVSSWPEFEEWTHVSFGIHSFSLTPSARPICGLVINLVRP